MIIRDRNGRPVELHHIENTTGRPERVASKEELRKPLGQEPSARITHADLRRRAAEQRSAMGMGPSRLSRWVSGRSGLVLVATIPTVVSAGLLLTGHPTPALWILAVGVLAMLAIHGDQLDGPRWQPCACIGAGWSCANRPAPSTDPRPESWPREGTTGHEGFDATSKGDK